MSNSQQLLALASLVQSAALVHQLAHTGTCDTPNNTASLNSIITNSTDIEAIFSSPADLSTGLKTLNVALGNRPKSVHSIVLYAFTLITLEKKLMKNKKLLHQLSDEIIGLQKACEFFPINHPNSIARLAQLYKSTLGVLRPTVMISGKQIYLSNQSTADHIRALLLAGIRAASLWKSQGGRIWQLVFYKKRLLKSLNSIDF